uniref:Uncharacterized protein n=1 Tax=Rhizophora mucronata TaxID=61149 RepID=A0A2P2ITK0_RHIMU
MKLPLTSNTHTFSYIHLDLFFKIQLQIHLS